jgi:colicin import membrane protein
MSNEENTTQESPVIVLEPDQINALYQHPETKEKLVDSIRTSVMSLIPDTTTAKGRDAIKSLAYQVTRSKTAVLEIGKKMIADLRAKYEADTEQTRGVVKYLDEELTALAKAVRKPLTDWEEDRKREQERMEKRTADIARLSRPTDEFGRPLDLDGLRMRLSSLGEYTPETQDEEEALVAGAATIADAIALEEKRIAEQAELDRLRKEAEERKRIEEEIAAIQCMTGLDESTNQKTLLPPDEINLKINSLKAIRSDNERIKKVVAERLFLLEAQHKESVAAEEAKRERARAEIFAIEAGVIRDGLDKAGMTFVDLTQIEIGLGKLVPVTEQERQFAADLAIETGNKRAEMERVAEEARKQREERIAREAEEKAKREADERAAKQAEEAKRAQDEAVRKERERIEAAQKKEAEEKVKREADQAHRAKINGEALADLVSAVGLDDDDAKAVVVAIATGKVRNVSIQY